MHELTSVIERLDPASLFPAERPWEVELGSGDGSFLVKYAAKHSERNFIGVERLLGRLRKTDRKGRRAQLTNLRLVRIESAYFLEYLLPRGVAAALHIYFPDPWPKRRHRRLRLINQRFPELAAAALGPRGTVYLRTDDADYFSQMREVFFSSTAFQEVNTPEELAETITDFEAEFHARGIQTLRAAYQKV